MKGLFRNTTPGQIAVARRELAELRDQRELVELRYARASAALDKLTDRAPGRRAAWRAFHRGALAGALFPGLLIVLAGVFARLLR